MTKKIRLIIISVVLSLLFFIFGWLTSDKIIQNLLHFLIDPSITRLDTINFAEPAPFTIELILSFTLIPLLPPALLLSLYWLKKKPITFSAYFIYFAITIFSFVIGSFLKIFLLEWILSYQVAPNIQNQISIGDIKFYSWGLYFSFGIIILIFFVTKKIPDQEKI